MKKRNYITIIEVLVFLLIMAIIIYKYPSPYMHKMLWAEDGTIYLSQSLENIWTSFFRPYAGYILLYPRIVAAVALLFKLTYTPIIYLIGTIFVILAIVHFIFLSFDTKIWKKILIALMIPLTRVEPIIFSNEANIQWFFAVILIIMLSCEYNLTTKFKKTLFTLFTLLAGLTGPYSVILLPVSALRIYFKKDFKNYIYFYIPFFITSLIQGLTMIFTPRVSEGFAINSFSFYINNLTNIFTHVTSYAFTSWILLLALIYLFIKATRSGRYPKIFIATSLLLSGFLITLSSIIINTSPNLWSDGNGCRYTYNLYFSILVSIILLIENKDIILGLIVLFFTTLKSTRVFEPNIYWDSYLLFNKYVKEIYARINPNEWSIYLKNDNKNLFKMPNYILSIKTANRPINFITQGSKVCPVSPDIGIVFQTELMDQSPDDIYIKTSIKEKVVKLSPHLMNNTYKYFAAFPVGGKYDKFIIFIPKDERHTIYNMNIYCLGNN